MRQEAVFAVVHGDLTEKFNNGIVCDDVRRGLLLSPTSPISSLH